MPILFIKILKKQKTPQIIINLDNEINLTNLSYPGTLRLKVCFTIIGT